MSDEPKKKSSKHDPSRRKFLKGVGVASAGAALADELRWLSRAPPCSVPCEIALNLESPDQNWSVTWVLAARAR